MVNDLWGGVSFYLLKKGKKFKKMKDKHCV